MYKFVSIAVASLFAANLAFAESPAACETKALTKDGKPLHGAAKAAFMKKCVHDGAAPPPGAAACESKAVSKEGKPLHGAAKAAFMKKCVNDGAAS